MRNDIKSKYKWTNWRDENPENLHEGIHLLQGRRTGHRTVRKNRKKKGQVWKYYIIIIMGNEYEGFWILDSSILHSHTQTRTLSPYNFFPYRTLLYLRLPFTTFNSFFSYVLNCVAWRQVNPKHHHIFISPFTIIIMASWVDWIGGSRQQ